MSRPMTRVCTKCRHRKPLGDFYCRRGRFPGYRAMCKSCHRTAERRRRRRLPRTHPRAAKLGMIRCQYCETEVQARTARQRTCSAVACQRALRREQKQRMRMKSATGICVDCGATAYFNRCEPCRAKHQREVEESFCAPTPSAVSCDLPVRGGICHEVLTFGTDFLGRTTTQCPRHGERLMRIHGVHRYPQRVTLEDELDAAVERASKAPQPKPTDHLGGTQWRRESNAYVGDHPWRQKKRSAA